MYSPYDFRISADSAWAAYGFGLWIFVSWNVLFSKMEKKINDVANVLKKV